MAMIVQQGWRSEVTATLRKFTADVDEYRRRYGKAEGERRFNEEQRPYEERVTRGNLLLRDGVEELWKLVIGGTAQVFDYDHARIGVGDGGDHSAVDTQTDLQGDTKTYIGMDSTYPQVSGGAGKKVTFRSTFGTGDGNHAWSEWVVDNKNHVSPGTKCLNRKVEALGTKSGGTWQLTVDISLS